jgi:hypothetical protein
MFYGYCFLKVNGQYTPKVKLNHPEEAFNYCHLQSRIFPEVRIADEDDFTVMRVVNHILYIPWEGGQFKAFDLRTGEAKIFTEQQFKAEVGD